MEEAAKPKTQLKSFWEAQRPAGVNKPSSPMRRAEGSGEGRKWQVRNSCVRQITRHNAREIMSGTQFRRSAAQLLPRSSGRLREPGA